MPYIFLWIWPLLFNNMFLRFTQVIMCSSCSSFTLLNSILLYEYTTTSISILLLMDFEAISSLRGLQIELLWSFLYMSCRQYVHVFLLGIFPINDMGIYKLHKLYITSILLDTFKNFLKCPTNLHSSSSVCMYFLSIFSPTLHRIGLLILTILVGI